MHNQRSADYTWLPDDDEVARLVLGSLMRWHPGLLAVDDLVRELSEPSLGQQIDAPLIHDALADLARSGLIHRLDRFILATRAMARAHELAA